MRAVNFEDIKVGDRILVHLNEGDYGYPNFVVLIVRGIDLEGHSIVSNMNGGLNISPNDDDQYIVFQK